MLQNPFYRKTQFGKFARECNHQILIKTFGTAVTFDTQNDLEVLLEILAALLAERSQTAITKRMMNISVMTNVRASLVGLLKMRSIF